MKHTLVILPILVFLVSCKTNKTKEVIAIVDGQEISMNALDQTIEKPLFHMFEGIYMLRKQALDEYISSLLLQEEAKQQGLGVDELLNNEILPTLTDSAIDAKILELGGIIPDPSDPFRQYDANTDFGREYLKKMLFAEARNAYAQSLKERHKVEIFLTSPSKNLRPKIDLEGIPLAYMGNEASKNTVVLIGSYSCEGCKQSKSLWDELINTYGKISKFAFCYFDAYPSKASLAAEAARLQGLFWEMHKCLLSDPNTEDSEKLMRYAAQIQMDTLNLRSCLEGGNKEKNQVERNIAQIEQQNISTLPLLVINGYIFHPPFDRKEIDEFIHQNFK